MAEPDPTPVAQTAPPPSDASGNVHDLGRVVESGLQRVRRLQHESHVLAKEQVQLLARDVNTLALRAGEIAEGGEAFPIGVRELCSRLADDLAQQAQTLLAIMERAPKY